MYPAHRWLGFLGCDMTDPVGLACPSDPEDAVGLSAWAIARARSLGFSRAGVCDARPSDRRTELEAWIDVGKHGPMAWMAAHMEVRLNVAKMFDGAKSILVVADRYHDGRGDERPAEVHDASRRVRVPAGRVARYARGRDYHRRMKRRLRTLQHELEAAQPTVRGKVCCDIEPFMEREHAQRAGLGSCGKHTLLIAPGLGSWLLLAAYVTTAKLFPSETAPPADPCGTCTRCIDACPTKAITAWSVDSRRCLSSVTLEERGSPSAEVAANAGEWLLGCDICQEVCPHNQPTRRSRREGVGGDFDGRNAAFALLEVLDWDDAARRRAFGPSALNRVRSDQVRRNAIWCCLRPILEGRGADLLTRIDEIARDANESAITREAASEVIARVHQA